MTAKKSTKPIHGIHDKLRPLAVPIASLTPDPQNAREHGRESIDTIKTSLEAYGQRKPVVVQRDGLIVRAGNGMVEAAKALGWTHIAALVVDEPAEDAAAFALMDNRSALSSRWNDAMLAEVLAKLPEDARARTGFTPRELAKMLEHEDGEGAEAQINLADELRKKWNVETGQVWQLGNHRIMCGDSTRPEDVARVMGGEKAQLIHADPPYGMGKEKDGIKNDNLYADKLDAFQMAWWKACRQFVEDNGSVYIWGNAESLWRLWYVGGLKDSERLTFRNEIVWDKGGGGFGVGTKSQRSYFPEERCLFFMLGEQGFNNNADNYWEGWEPIRSYLEQERNKMGWSNLQASKICGTSDMGKHWFTKSQWLFPTENAYKKLQAFAKGKAFKREYDDLKREYDDLKREYYSTRAYFDNTHDLMSDIWDFNRVVGENRFGHATPKPVMMICRAIKSSLPINGICLEPFSGSGSTLIACEQTGRQCRAIEISPGYVAVAIQRWADTTGGKPELLREGKRGKAQA